MKHEGIYITFEGNEGSGKGTLIKNLSNWLKGLKYKIFLTQEPGGTKIGKQIRRILVNKKNLDMSPKTELLLFIANRAQNIFIDVGPKKEKGYIVLSDRGLDSSKAYQGAARKISLDMVDWLNDFSVGKLIPDFTFILLVKPEIGLERVRKHDRGKESKEGELDRIENEKLKFHQKVYQQYKKMAESHKRYILVDTTEPSSKQVFEQVKRIFEEKIFPKIKL